MNDLDIKISSITAVIKLNDDGARVIDVLTFATYFDSYRIPNTRIVNFNYGDSLRNSFYAYLEIELELEEEECCVKCKLFDNNKIQFTGAKSLTAVDKVAAFFESLYSTLLLLHADHKNNLKPFFYDILIDEDSNLLYSAKLLRIIGKRLNENDFIIAGKKCRFKMSTGTFNHMNQKQQIIFTPDYEYDTKGNSLLVDRNPFLKQPTKFTAEIVNIWANTNIPKPPCLDLLYNNLQLQKQHHQNFQISYDPKLYKGINIRMYNHEMQKIVSIIIRSTGLVMLSGKSLFNIKSNFTYFYHHHIVSIHNHSTQQQAFSSASCFVEDIF